MSKSIEPADRRPLVYGVFVLLILVAASYLFWPRTPRSDSLVLTPESVRTESAAADMSTASPEAGTGAAPETGLATMEVGESHAIAEETSISDEAPAPARTRPAATESATAEQTRTESAPRSTEPARNTATAVPGPSTSGEWVLNVGAFSTEANARSRAEDLTRQGLTAHVHRAVSNGRSVWRVRVGYFASKAKADEYAAWMKSTRGIEGWAGSR